ncbi:hypothetical protein NQ176_g8359 [Zarea fungicola]|uniref:Uncharacterized protein n=1 Tax=Zarea fungicola TaxID=93591 RepID=A0ACC1MTR8_9HYPO|nr:hypothetical protein NQ176_g8359 [Lecanicillium fungicola]
MKFSTFGLFIGLVSAEGVMLQLFDGAGCDRFSRQRIKVVGNAPTNIGGKVIGTVNTNSGAADQNSGCVAANFKSTRFAQFSPGFKCNIYTDSACQTLSQSLTARTACDTFPGSSVLCFSQADFDNAFAESTVSVTVGSKNVGVSQNTDSLFKEGIALACSDTGCDPTNKRQFPYRHFNQDGFTSISLTGTYENANQRDYMQEIFLAVQDKTLHNIGVDLRGSSEDDDKVADQFTFFQVVIRDSNGSIQAQMTATIDTTTQSQKEGDCGIVGQIESVGLGAIPGVGGLAAKAFNFVCQKAG